MKQLIKFTIFFLMSGLTFISCKKETTPSKTNQPPVASAGSDWESAFVTANNQINIAGWEGVGTIRFLLKNV